MPHAAALVRGLALGFALSATAPDAPPKRFAWVTIADSSARYKSLAIVLLASLRRVGTKADCVLLCAGCALDARERGLLASLRVDVHNTTNPVALAPDAEARLFGEVRDPDRSAGQRSGAGDFIKLRAHELVAYDRVVLLDADMLALARADELFDAAEGAHCDGPRSPLNAGLVVIAPRRGDFDELVRTAAAANYSKHGGWRGEGPCRNTRARSLGCFNRNIMQGLWHWWYVSRHAPRGDKDALRAARDRLLLPRDRYNALQDEPARGSGFADIALLHLWNCHEEIGAANRCDGASTHRDDVTRALPRDDATGARRLRKTSKELCTQAWRAWAAEVDHVCAAAPPPRSSCCHALSPAA